MLDLSCHVFIVSQNTELLPDSRHNSVANKNISRIETERSQLGFVQNPNSRLWDERNAWTCSLITCMNEKLDKPRCTVWCCRMRNVWEMYEKCMSDACELARNSKPSKWYHFNSVPGSSRLHVRVLEGKIERQPLRTRTGRMYCQIKLPSGLQGAHGLSKSDA